MKSDPLDEVKDQLQRECRKEARDLVVKTCNVSDLTANLLVLDLMDILSPWFKKYYAK